jgi:serine/threonine protein phosphatase PrpC
MTPFETTSVLVPSGKRCEDRIAVIESDAGVVIVVADGAGGIGDGAAAADRVISEVKSSASLSMRTSEWCDLLRQVDLRVGPGQSTCVVAAVTQNGIQGASVGDSEAWVFEGGEWTDLTRHQIRKPLLGTQLTTPVGFSHPENRGVLLVATDGFCKYIRPKALADQVRLPSGAIWDDVGIVVCRRRVRTPPRMRFDLDG